MWSLPKFIAPPRTHFGLSLGRTSIRGIELDSKGTIKAATEIALPDGIFSEGVLVRKDIYTDLLKKFLAGGKFSTSYVSVCFSEAHAYNREYTLPKIPFDEVQEAVSWHIKDLFPFPESDIYFDWKILEARETEYSISVVAVPKKMLDPLVEVLASVGLKPLSFSPGASVIAQFLRLPAGSQRLVIEVNKKGAYVTLIEGPKIIFTTVVNYTAEDTADTYLTNINQTVAEIASFYKQKGIFKTEGLEIILTGELTQDGKITSFLGQLGYPLKALNNPLNKPAFNKAYAVAISHAAPSIDPQTINLLPEKLQTHYDSERNQTFYKTVAVRALGATAVLFLLSLGAYLAVSLKRQTLEQESRRLQTILDQKPTETQSLLLLNSQAKDVVELSPLKKTPLASLAILQSIIPESIRVTQWDYDDSKLFFTLVGTAATRGDLLEFKNKLESTAEFAKITLPLGSLEVAENVKFNLTFVVQK